MKLGRDLLVGFAREFQGLDFSAQRAPKIAAELERLVDGALKVAGTPALSDDPDGFLAALEELADPGE
jgi:hypothetical protein